jgi:hypothetical protein
VAAREDGLTDRLSLSLANACNPLLQAHPPWAQDNTSHGSLFPPCVPSRADPSGLGHAATIYSSIQGPPGVETPTGATHADKATHGGGGGLTRGDYDGNTPIFSAAAFSYSDLLAGKFIVPLFLFPFPCFRSAFWPPGGQRLHFHLWLACTTSFHM